MGSEVWVQLYNKEEDVKRTIVLDGMYALRLIIEKFPEWKPIKIKIKI